MTAHRRALIELHICVVLWGFTAILGKLITLPALQLVWWRMLLVTVALACFPRVWRALKIIPPRQHARVRRHRRRGGAALARVLRLGEARERVGRGDRMALAPVGHRAHRAGDHRRALRTT